MGCLTERVRSRHGLEFDSEDGPRRGGCVKGGRVQTGKESPGRIFTREEEPPRSCVLSNLVLSCPPGFLGRQFFLDGQTRNLTERQKSGDPEITFDCTNGGTSRLKSFQRRLPRFL